MKGVLVKFIAKVNSGEVVEGSILIVENSDRLSRENVDAALEQLRTLVNAGIEVVTLSDGQRYD